MNADGLVIIGGSLAGAKAAEAARAEGWSGAIRLVGMESHLPYERPPFSKGVLIGRDEPSSAEVQPGSFYVTNEIDLLLGTAATAVDLGDMTVELDGGRRLRFDRLVLATGSTVRSLRIDGAGLPEVHTLRTIDDALALARRTASWPCASRSSGGAGSALRSRRARANAVVTSSSVSRCRRCWSGRWAPRSGSTTASSTDSTAFGSGSDSVWNASRAATTWRACASPTEPGSRRTSWSSVSEFALTFGWPWRRDSTQPKVCSLTPHWHRATPTCSWPGTSPRRSIRSSVNACRVEHWANALNQGLTAGANAAGASKIYDRIPYFDSDQYDSSMEYSGWPIPWDRVEFRGDPSDAAFVAFYLQGDRLVGGANVNVPEVNQHVQRLIRDGGAVDVEQLTDAAVDPSEWASPLADPILPAGTRS